jgi:hypothetical protein
MEFHTKVHPYTGCTQKNIGVLSGLYGYVSSRSRLYPTSDKRATVEISNCTRKSCFLTLSRDSATVQNGNSRTQSFLCSAACEVQFGGYSSAGVPATIWT